MVGRRRNWWIMVVAAGSTTGNEQIMRQRLAAFTAQNKCDNECGMIMMEEGWCRSAGGGGWEVVVVGVRKIVLK